MLKRIVTLIVPYIIFSIAFVILQHLSGKVNSLYSYSSLLLIWKEPISYLWYIYALALVYFFCGILDLLNMSVEYQLLLGGGCTL